MQHLILIVNGDGAIEGEMIDGHTQGGTAVEEKKGRRKSEREGGRVISSEGPRLRERGEIRKNLEWDGVM